MWGEDVWLGGFGGWLAWVVGLLGVLSSPTRIQGRRGKGILRASLHPRGQRVRFGFRRFGDEWRGPWGVFVVFHWALEGF